MRGRDKATGRFKSITETATKSANSQSFLDPKKYRVGLFDIESTGLRGDFGLILCCSFKTWGTSEVITHIIDLDISDLIEAEGLLLNKINNTIASYDGLIGYYSSRFDIPMIRTRNFYHGFKAPIKQKHLDLYFTVKRVFNSSTRRLDRINEILKVCNPDKSPDKTKVGIKEWNAVTLARDKKALNYIVDHNIKDVEILENAVIALKDFIPDRIMRS